ncbi:YheV family putative metal-binding protein [Dasania sp. GY-MA-18]|uniref:YheV family putative metal-binding protein n=1 Tax=Dasania phycosphaerae TaxID=2950436 RepID=A0A9J6RPQ9_9GAMM|nr:MULTISPECIES: YheV family putative zinc ribbon protein [Dasania]MCR8923855.1 YheV family putative metal-binding protein [Dasania sp. GY-MA-18]MCZ0866289.1 YheV family putative metal-binding protein [Dasania phycosphaerae]MCZ0870013.1 YheV family putative metal-binding protein [Dasania phycosphaerae]
MTEKTIKRFIAGAVCPRCAEMDKLVMFRNEQNQQVRECVRCGYSDVMNENGQAEEISTRVNQPRVGEKPLAHEDEVSVVNIMDPKKKH